LRTPTIRGLATAIAERGYFSPSECLIPIQPEGSRPPLFCIHGVRGEANNWFQLARELGPEQPLYTLQALGLDGASKPHRSVAEMAAWYAREIERARPAGPVHVFGYSVGALLAHECARQLVASGRTVGLLILLDPLDLGNYGRGWKLLRRVNRRLGPWRPRPKAPTALAKARAETPRDVVEESIRRALRAHVPQPYDGAALLFQPSETGFLVRQNCDVPWRGLIRGGITLRVVGGDHFSMVEPPHLEGLARELDEALRQASGHLCLG
jgi:thioesterase domain-containing protein